MLNKFVLTFLAAGAIMASAASGTYKVSVLENSVIDGKQVKAGDYKIEMKDGNTAILKHGRDVVEVPAHEKTVANKFPTTELQYDNQNHLNQINIGGTKTAIVFTPGAGVAGSGD